MKVVSDLSDNSVIDLAHEPAFALGSVRIRPSTREVVRADGRSEVLEPRVIQVMIALAKARGEIVTRDELTERCWEGRIVGEDAINRVISRLRAAAKGIGGGAFRIDTVTKVGYRLMIVGAAEPLIAPNTAASASPASPPEHAAAAPGLPRRAVIIGGAAAIAAIGVAGLVITRSRSPAGPPPDVAPLILQAQTALRQASSEGDTQAIGLLRRVVAMRPDYPDGWSELAMTYAIAAGGRPDAEAQAMRAQGWAAAQRSLALDAGNALARVSIEAAKPGAGNWWPLEQALLAAIVQHPERERLFLRLGILMSEVGRFGKAIARLAESARVGPPSPVLYFKHVLALWGANRLEEADRLAEEATATYPTHFAVWFTQFYLLMYTGRADAALAKAANRSGRPTGIPDGDFDTAVEAARALGTGSKSAIDAAMANQMVQARRGAGYAENAIQFAAVTGRIEDGFAIANAYFFDRGFTVGDVRFTTTQGIFTPRPDRETAFLFMPQLAAMRADRRFDALVNDIGLKRYWAASGSRPDYMSG